MRILFKDEEHVLNSIEATHISYEEKDKTLWFYTDGQIFQTDCNKIYAEARIKEAYTEGKVDLSDMKFEIYEENE